MSATREGQALLDAWNLDAASVRLIGCLLGGLNLTPIGLLLCLRAAGSGDNVLLLVPTGLLLMAAGSYLGWLSWTQLRADDQAPRSLPPRTKGKPWTSRRDWRPDRMTTEVAEVNRFQVGMALFWSLPSWLIVLGEWSGGVSGGDVMLLIVPGMTNVGLYLALKERIRDVRFGQTGLRLETKPAVMGRRVAAVFQTGFRPETFKAERFTVRLSCYHRYITHREDSDGDRERVVVRDVKWSDDKDVRPRVGRDGLLEIPVSFQIPTGYPEATPRQKDDRIGWEVKASADVPGVDYEAAFEVPVYTAETVGEENLPDEAEDADPAYADAGEETSPSPYANYEIVPDFDAPVSQGITMERTPTGGLRFDFAARRNGMGILLFGFFALFTTALSAAMITGGAVLMGLFVSAFALVSIYGLGHALTRSSSLVVGQGRVRLVTRHFGMETEQAFPAQHLAGVRSVAEGFAGKTTYYTLYLHREEQDEEAAHRLRVADSIGDEDEAEWMCARIIAAAEKEAEFT